MVLPKCPAPMKLMVAFIISIEKHIAALEDADKMMSHLYKTLALATLELTSLPTEKREELKSLLSS